MPSPYALMKGDTDIPQEIEQAKIFGGTNKAMTCDMCGQEYVVIHFPGDEGLIAGVQEAINENCGQHSERLTTVKTVEFPVSRI